MKWALFLVAVAVVAARRETEAIIALHTPNLPELERILLDEVSNAKSARYGRFLSNKQIESVIGLPDAVLKRATKLLRKAGFREIRVTGHRDHLRAVGPAVPHAQLRPELRALVHSVHYKEDSPLNVARKTRGPTRKAALMKHYANRSLAQGQIGDPNSQRTSYGIPQSQAVTRGTTTGLVWGPGTYGYLSSDLAQFYNEWGVNANVNSINTTANQGVPGGDNFGECTLDVSYTTGIANGLSLMVSNTNTSSSTEEGNGFGYAFMDFSLSLASAPQVPGVVSLSLGSLSAYACSTLCQIASTKYGVRLDECNTYLQGQRQICMMDSQQQQAAISTQLMKVGLRGTTVVAAAGDGGSHFSFVFFPDHEHIGHILNTISCDYNFPTFPASSPYVLAVGGTQWNGAPSPSQPIAWSSGGSGFSWQFPTPPYQATVVKAYLAANSNTANFPPPGSFNPSGRAYPDLAALADNIPMVEQGEDQVTGGTSASAPEWAGVIALLNDIRNSRGLSNLGFFNTRLYQQNGQGTFDVTSGNSKCAINGCCSTGFPAARGWDAMTGWGSPSWTTLVDAYTKN